MAKTWDKVGALDQKVDALDRRVGSLETKVESLSTKSDMQFEKTQADIRTLAEGLDEGLKGISRQISDVCRSWEAEARA